MPLVDGALLVSERRKALYETSLGIRCDRFEVPTPRTASGPAPSWWIAGKARYSGPAARAIDDGQLIEPEVVAIEGTAAAAVGAERVLGIVSPDDYRLPALWWGWDLRSVEVTTEGRQGMFSRRPRIVVIERHGATVSLSMVSKLNRDSGRHRPAQEHRLVRTLTPLG